MFRAGCDRPARAAVPMTGGESQAALTSPTDGGLESAPETGWLNAGKSVLKQKAMQDTPITMRRYTDFDEIKADEYRYWQSRPRMSGWMRLMNDPDRLRTQGLGNRAG